jgi:type III secretion system low calcium response chaperone LcrH/SycD
MTQQINFTISPTALKHLSDKNWVQKQLSDEMSVQNMIGFSDETMDQFYAAACHIFENKNYDDASKAFLFLVTINPYHYDYWLGLGAATQHCHDYEAAIDAYEMAAICQLDNPIPYFHLANCLFAMHDRDSALKAIEMVLEYSTGNDEYTDLRQKAIAAKGVLEHEDH